MDDEPEAPQDRPLTFFSATIWALIAILLTFVFVGVTDSAREGARLDPVSSTGCLALAYSAVLFGVLRLHEPQTSIRHILALRRPSVLVCLLAIAAGLALSLPSEWLDNTLAKRWATSKEDAEALETFLNVSTMGKRVGLFATLVIVQPVMSELFFRGVLFTPLRRTRTAETVLLAATAFETLSMVSPRAMLSLLAAALVFSWIRGITGSVIPAILAHVAFNALGVVPMVLGKHEIEPTGPILLASAVTGVVALVGLSFLARGSDAVLARQADAGEVPL